MDLCDKIKLLTNKYMTFYYYLLHGLSKYDVCLQFCSVRTGWNVILWSRFLMSNVNSAKDNNNKNPYAPNCLPAPIFHRCETPLFIKTQIVRCLLSKWQLTYIFFGIFYKRFLLSPDVYRTNGWQVNLWLGWIFIFWILFFNWKKNGLHFIHTRDTTMV